MIAVFKHELHTYFHSLIGYVFGSFLLVFVGIGAMLYNLEMAVSNFEYVLGFSSIIFVIIIPILTMRTLAEERRQKTDQLLYSLPISTVDVIVGKFSSRIPNRDSISPSQLPVLISISMYLDAFVMSVHTFPVSL